MSGVWISEMLSDGSLGDKNGVRCKFPGSPWEPAQFERDFITDDHVERQNKYKSGYRLTTAEVPECIAIWSPSHFARRGDIFSLGSMYVIRPRLAEVFARFDLGEGGVEPLTVYEADLQTRAKGEFFMLHFGARKDSFLPDDSNKEGFRINPLSIDRKTGLQNWTIESWVEDGDVAVSSAALGGADLWFEPRVYNRFFVSDALAQALVAAKPRKVDFGFKRCRIVEGGQ